MEMGTKGRADVATTGRIMKHVNPSEDDEKMRHNNYEMVPKLPSVKITHKEKPVPSLSDFLDGSNTADTKRSSFQLNPIGKEKAFAILKQYNKLVSSETTLAVTNIPAVKIPLPKKHQTPRTLPKPEATPRKVPIFTEGISSISKSSQPSFLVPKDKVLRANLPNNVIVAHRKDNFSFGVKMPKRRSPKEVDDDVKFKQMHNLGLDSLPIINLEKYMKTKPQPTSGVKGSKPIVNMNKTSKPRRLDPIASESKLKTTLDLSKSNDFSNERKKVYRWKAHNSARSEGKANVVWVGNTLSSEFAENRTRILKGIYPQYDSRMKNPEEFNRLKYRDPTVYGVCSLAPIDIIGHSSKLLVADAGSDIEGKRFKGEYRRYHKVHQTRSNVHDYYFESDSDSSLNTDWKNMINNAMTYRSSSAESGTMTPRGIPNPPPSYVSSSNDDEMTIVPLEISKTMHRIQEERTSLMESASNRVQQTFSAGSNELPLSPAPAVIVVNDEPAVEEEISKDRKITPRKGKEPILSSVIELKIDDKHLNVPKLMDSERRPPIKTDITDSSSQSYTSSELVKNKTSVSGQEQQKLNVKTLQLNASNERPSPLPPFNTVLSDVEMTGTIQKTRNSKHEKADLISEEPFKHITVNSKTLQFISPLSVQANAKRQ